MGKKVEDYNRFLEVLRAEVVFPSYYYFKFIVKFDNKEQVIDLFKPDPYEITPSSKGSYVSISSQKLVKSAEEIVDIYVKASSIDGVIAL